MTTEATIGKEATRFNWKLPIFGAIGFGLGFAITGAITWTLVQVSQNAIADIFPGTSVQMFYPVYRGVIVGGLGGASLGLAFKNKAYILPLVLFGAIAFAIGFWFVVSVIPENVRSVGEAIMRLFGAPDYLSEFEMDLAYGLGIGICIGGIGGLGLGLASPRNKLIAALLLCITGIFWFGNAFAFGDTILEAGLNSPWNWMGGAIGGILFGLVLGLSDWLAGRRKIEKPAIPEAG